MIEGINSGKMHRELIPMLPILTLSPVVFGMGVDLATILSTMGTVGVGNPLSLKPGFSIGAESKKSQNLLGNLLGLLGQSSPSMAKTHC